MRLKNVSRGIAGMRESVGTVGGMVLGGKVGIELTKYILWTVLENKSPLGSAVATTVIGTISSIVIGETCGALGNAVDKIVNEEEV